MITREQFFRAFQTVAVPIALGLVARYFWGDIKEETPPSLFIPLLADIDFVPRALPATYRIDVPELDAYERVSVYQNATVSGKPEVTAVILNWSRVNNLMLITSLLCAPWLEETVAEVFIWNNSPRKLRYEDMKNTGCPRSKLRIHNAQANMLFEARYLACAQSSTPYCFIQDDDFLVRSEIIQSMHAHIREAGNPRALHLLPPHEHLSTTLREIHVPAADGSGHSEIHTSFAWLGHGTMMHRSQASSLLGLLHYLKATPDEVKMADNFFTILSNRVPEIWFDQGFELGGGQPFTVGSEGDERNKKYILRATEYLEALARCRRASCDESPTLNAQQAPPRLPYVALGSAHKPTAEMRAACRGAVCLLETNIRILPAEISHAATKVADIFSLETENTEILGEHGKTNYLDYALSHAVDIKTDSVFRSLTHATKGDTLLLDILADISEAREWTAIELVWLVDVSTENILKSCAFEWSSDKVTWNTVSNVPICYDTQREAGVDGSQIPLRECSVQMLLGSSALHLRATGRYFRARLQEDAAERWIVAEVWLRGF